MNTILEIAQNYTLLKHLPNEVISACLKEQTMQIRNFTKEEVIHFDSDVCTKIELIIKGEVVVERIDDSGDLLTIASFSPDDIIGGNLVFSKNPYYPMTVTAKTNTRLLVIHKDLLFHLCANYTPFLKSYLEYISDHALLLGDKLKHYVNRSIRESLIAYLKNEYKLQQTTTIALRTSKKALAERIGVQRTSLSRELQKMKVDGLIDYDLYSVTILDSGLIIT